ncbi:DNA excision repair protein ERCC-2 [Clostridium tetanomorphum]|uniref:ATP-dependent DNA helicase n=1 Tax=Clostridium tetanomorphum TaxID=1553 RepID=A0A923J0X4_CLOTT|nr:ATP-dependent DNA helicase [Clostridium tetanomorphum]KAJ52930.1 DEAD2 protein [Clostridium tetanomorphum DSM 665]MBC2398184.1 ATP-dependent DNA helicase [Clostridium tetanomorphum]MBP1864870.1 DNA excision repair protein ERCC-2 [Clostridium tetanomorphum]NRS83076.1 DNA excision repair protein ERCC-2 [Clostridium tetanomorphum]NRZ98827.1 DNA excision repair protein ERCC-2 [Clostridium tetanomorphum]
MNNEVRISVRNLVEFILRTGDLDSTFIGSSRAVDGTRIHQKIQKNKGEDYLPEVSLKHTFEYRDMTITLEGRADGIIKNNDEIIIDEIKSTTRDIEGIDENYNPLHMAQVKCYAYIYAKQNEIPIIGVQLTYCQVETGKIKYILNEYSLKELESFFYSLIEKYYVWAKFTKDWSEKRDKSIKELTFPFLHYRRGQRELAVAVYRTISQKKNIFLQAPTGIGKTISTIFPGVKAVGEKLISKIFYLTAKTITSSVALEAFNKMEGKGLQFKVATITAKDKICFKDKPTCNGEQCEFAKGHFDRVNEVIMKILKRENLINRIVIEKYSKEYKVCPFELSLDLTLWADCVICDYNYVFDPRVYLKRFFDAGKEDYLFLIDEAHNLVDRGREMFSAELTKEEFLNGKKLTKNSSSKLYKIFNKLNSYMLDMNKKCNEDGFYMQKEEPLEIYPYLRNLVNEGEEWLKGNEKGEGYEEILQIYFNVLAFLRISEFYDGKFVTYVEKEGKNSKLKLFCLNPANLLNMAIKRGRSGIFFSATLTPIKYFKDILGGDKDDYSMRFESPFSIKNRALMIASNISTRYKNRENSVRKIVDYIKAFIKIKKGNYLVFFPSYKYMDMVLEVFEKEYNDVKIIVQNSFMKEEEREEFLNNFYEEGEKTLVAFSVLGGIFSEGIDLKGERLSGAIIVGVGLPQIGFERNIIMNHFNEENNCGYEYSYMYPGMNKVLQAAGRVIRSEKDIGAILLIDDRFTSKNYQKLFPREWMNNFIVRSSDDIEKILGEFWKSKK